MFLRQIFDPWLAQYAYLIGCQRTGEAVVIDPERDVDRYLRVAEENSLRITAVAETHIHADFVSGARELAEDPGMRLYLSAEGGTDWTYRWPQGRERVHFLRHGDAFSVGNIRVEAVHTPGHTPEHVSYLVTDLGGGADRPMALATGDFVFVGDVGRPDLLESAAGVKGAMEPSARILADALRGCLSGLEDFVQILPGHGAGSACGKALGAVPVSTLGYERRFNGALKTALTDREAFVRDILSGQPEPPMYFATMKRVNRDGIAVTRGVPRGRRSAADAVSGSLREGLRVVDARADRAEFAAGHIAGSLYAPLRSPFFSASAGSYLEESDRILLLLENEQDADLAERQLYRIGFDHVEAWVTEQDARASGLLDTRIERIDFSDFDPVQARGEGVILDVRTSAEFAAGHLEGAMSIPYTRLKARLAEVPRDRRLFIHCGSGKRAALAAAFLQREGFAVMYVDGACDACERIAQAQGVTH